MILKIFNQSEHDSYTCLNKYTFIKDDCFDVNRFRIVKKQHEEITEYFIYEFFDSLYGVAEKFYKIEEDDYVKIFEIWNSKTTYNKGVIQVYNFIFNLLQ